VLQPPDLELVVPLSGAWVVRFIGDQVAPAGQLVAFDGRVVVDGPAVISEGGGGVVNTNRKTVLPR
jgi:hypothetical protein